MSFPFRHFITLITLACFTATAGWAQRVYWDPPGGELPEGRTSTLNLVFEDCSPEDRIDLPAVAGVDFGTPSRSQQTSIINFQMSSRTVLSYPARPQSRNDIVIPAFDAPTNKGKISVGEVRFRIGNASVGQSGTPIEDIVTSQVRPAKSSVWAGEVVEVEYILIGSTRYSVTIGDAPEWKPEGAVSEPFGEAENITVTIGNERRPGARYRTRVVFTQPGTYPLEPAKQLVNIQTGERPGFLFSQPRIEQFTITSNAPEITVKPLPQPAPPEFTGAVGTFAIESKVVPQNAHVGEPITWTLSLAGSGNWTASPTLPEREVSQDFQVVQPKSRLEMDGDKLFQGRLTEDAVLLPTKVGTYTLGPVSFASFDPAKGQYVTQTTERVTVMIDPAPLVFTPSVPQEQTAPSLPAPATDASPLALPGSSAAVPPPALPGDLDQPSALPAMPLPIGEEAAPPRRIEALWLVLAAIAPPLLLWPVLAAITASRHDPARHRKRALNEMRRMLEQLARTGGGPDIAAFEQWRTLSACFGNVWRPTPTVDDLAASIESLRGASRPDAWLELWREAESAMFSARVAPPKDWVSRAISTSRATRVRSGAAWLPRRSRHWAPPVALLLAAVALTLAIFATPARAADAADAYRDGRFEEARDAWLNRLAHHPTDWAAHNNAALACAQLDDWAAATAHWTAAYLLNPHDTSARGNLRLAVTRMDAIDPAVRRLVEPPLLERPVTMLSPAEWQGLLTGGAAGLGLGLMTVVISLYVKRGRIALRTVGQGMSVFAVLALIASGCALWRYDIFAEPQVGMITQPTDMRSIPSELAEKQQTAPVAPGTVVRIERSFLGWDRVVATGGTAGWVRHEMVLPLFRSSRPAPASLAPGARPGSASATTQPPVS